MKFSILILIFFMRLAWPVEMISFGKPSEISIPRQFEVAVWNIYKGQKDEFKSDFIDLSSGKDLILLQEMYLSSPMKLFLESDELLFFEMAVSFRMPLSSVATGVATASKAKPLNTIPLKSEVSELGLFTPKSALISRYKIDGSSQLLTVINIHAINFVSSGTFAKQLEQIYLTIKDFKGPMIFAGDFNTWTDAKERVMYKVMKELNLTEVKFEIDNRIKFNGHYLDHIFYRGLRLVESSSRSDDFEGSDHRPMVASFDL